jgi:Fe-S-cluster containining protein
MSKKTKDKRKKKHKQIVQRRVSRKSRRRVPLKDKLQQVYSQVSLETTCCRQGTCCRVACPQMNFCEATQVLDDVWAEWDREAKKKLIKTSIRYYFSNSMVKPCPLIAEDDDGTTGCAIYENRPLNCRLFGQWPADAYERRVESFVEVTGFERHDLPLNTQCPHVRRKDTELELTEEIIQGMFAQLDLLDGRIGKFGEKEIEQRHNYRTIHDWVLVKFFGEDKLSMMTDFMLAAEPEEAAHFVEELEKKADELA